LRSTDQYFGGRVTCGAIHFEVYRRGWKIQVDGDPKFGEGPKSVLDVTAQT